MYLARVKVGAARGHYADAARRLHGRGSWERFWADVRLIAANCEAFNGPGREPDPDEYTERVVDCGRKLALIAARWADAGWRGGGYAVDAPDTLPLPDPDAAPKRKRGRRQS